MNQYFRTYALLAATLFLCGCVTFQNLPNVPLGCDSKLAGKWWGEKEQLEVVIDRQCHYSEPAKPESEKAPLVFKTFTINGNQFAAYQVPAKDGSPDGDYLILRYKLNNDQLAVYTADQTYAELAAERGQFKTETRAGFGGNYPSISGSSADVARILKDHPALFGGQSGEPKSKSNVYVFQRVSAAGKATPKAE